MVVKPPPPPKSKTDPDTLAKVWPDQELQQPPRTPWGRIFLLSFSVSLILAAGVIAGWGILAQRYPQSVFAQWWPASGSTTVVREVSTNPLQTVPSKVRQGIEELYGVAGNLGSGGVYAQSDILTSAVPLSSNGWFVAWSAALPVDTELVVVPTIGQPARVTQIVQDPATPFAFLRTESQDTASATLVDPDTNLIGRVVWLAQPGPASRLAISQVASAVYPKWELSDRLEYWFAMAQTTDLPTGSVAIDADGRVVGFLEADSGIWPVGVVEAVLTGLLQQGVVERPALGVYTVDRSRTVVEGDPTATGLLAGNHEGQPATLPGGPAELAGIEPGTVIYEIDGQPAEQPLFLTLLSFKPTDTIELTIDQDGVRKTVTALLGTVQP